MCKLGLLSLPRPGRAPGTTKLVAALIKSGCGGGYEVQGGEWKQDGIEYL